MNTPTTDTVTLKDFRLNLSEIVNRVAYGGDRVTITRNGKKSVVLVDQEDWDLLEALESASDLKALKTALKADDGTRIPFDQILQENGLKREDLRS
jgi:prevent-host-death family protein